MVSRLLHLLSCLLLMSTTLWAEPGQRRLVRLESHLYGWYAVISPEFDKTVGTRQLYKISGADQFLTGLSGRLVLLEGEFSKGVLKLPALAAPPESMPENTQRRVLPLKLPQTSSDYRSEDGYQIQDPNNLLSSLGSGRWQLDTLLSPEPHSSSYRLERLLQKTSLTWSRLGPEQAPDLDRPALLDLTLTQDLLNAVAEVGLEQAQLSTSYQGVTLDLSRLSLQLPDGSESVAQPWRLLGSLELKFGSSKLAESGFSVAAQPLVEENTFKLKPDWQSLEMQGQLPFSFVLGSSSLSDYTRYLPEKLPLIPLNRVSEQLQKEELLAADSQANWSLGTPAPGSVRLALSASEQPLPHPTQVSPGSFRLILGTEFVDRLLQRQVRRMLSPDTPYRPQPPLEVGKALFVPILVKEIYVRQLEAGYSNSVFRFEKLSIDVGWEAGPFSGLEPLLEAGGYIRPKLADENGSQFWSWDLVLNNLVVKSSKIPGDREKLAQEFKPQIEEALGPKLARENRFSNRFPLNRALPGSSGTLVLSRLRALDASLTLEGHIEAGE